MARDEKSDKVGGEYLLIRPEKIGWLDVLSLLILRRRLGGYKFVESSEEVRLRADWVTALTLVIQKILLAIDTPLKLIGLVSEFILNFFALNGGLLGLLWHLITCSVVFPKKDAANYRSIIGHIDGRLDLYKTKSLITYFSLMNPGTDLGDTDPLDLSMMASKIAYENAAYIENAVAHWKMNFVGFYNCWNKFLNDFTTQAFIFTDKAEDANLIVVAFRGTEPFNARDWSTDVDLSWIFTGLTGNIHVGFLKALGLQDEKNFSAGFPKEFNSPVDKPLAYYVIREALNTLLSKHPNAKILMTGHSLGAALAAIFPVLLSIHRQKNILSSMYAVMNYGQPRVGDAIFGTHVEKVLRLQYYRMVYRFDIVPRIPFDFPPVALFRHCGTCIYFDGWTKGQVVDDAPNPNYFDPLYQPKMYLNAWGDLLQGLFMGWTHGKDFKENWVSILYRASGLVIPGLASHSPRDYVNAGRLATISNKIMV